MMDVDPASNSSQNYTILRIKRKRTDEPLDALVVDANSRARRRKIRGKFDVFQFAETVEQTAWEDEKQKRDLQERVRVAALAHVVPEKPKTDVVEQAIPAIQPATAPAPVAPQPPKKSDTGRRYTVVKQPTEQPSPRRGQPTAPPKVISHKDLLKPKPDFTYYDAVPAGSKQAKDEDEEMKNFMPMLEEYLKISDIEMPAPGSSSRSSEDDYVWDVFYHRPAKGDELSKIAANIATLTGLPASFGHPDDSDSDLEVEDEADEDSNAEDHFGNDYPDEDEWDSSGGSDEFHDGSEDEELFASDHDDSADEEWINSAMRRR